MLIGYIVELVILIVWYLLILKNGFIRKRIFIRTIKLLFNLKYIIIKNILGIWELSEKQKKNFNNIRFYLIQLLMRIIYLFTYVLTTPIIIFVLIFTNSNQKNLNFIIAILIICGVLIKKLKEMTQQIILLVNNYTENIMVKLENNPDIININESQRIPVVWTKKKFIIFISFILFFTVFSVLFYALKDKHEIQVVSILILISYYMFEFIQSKRNSSICAEQGINVEGYIFESVKTEIVDMCNKIDINTIDFKMCNDNNVNAYSFINNEGVPQVRVSNGFINAIISNHNARGIFLITLGHELGHIYYKDSTNIGKRMKKTCLIALIGYIMMLLLIYGTSYYIWLFIPTVIIFSIEIIFGRVMTDIRYWEQIAELKADRLAVHLNEDGKDAFIDFWTNEYKENISESYNIVYQYYVRYIKNEAHPSMNRRMKLLKREKSWSYWEYFEHALIIRKWRLTNKGWNGE